jgi:hypothetical protein
MGEAVRGVLGGVALIRQGDGPSPIRNISLSFAVKSRGLAPSAIGNGFTGHGDRIDIPVVRREPHAEHAAGVLRRHHLLQGTGVPEEDPHP